MANLIEQTFPEADKLVIITEKTGPFIYVKIGLQNLDVNYSNSKRTVDVCFESSKGSTTFLKSGIIDEKVSAYGPIVFTLDDFPDSENFETTSYIIKVIVSNNNQPATFSNGTEDFDRFTYTFTKKYSYLPSDVSTPAATEQDVFAVISTEKYKSAGKKLYPPSIDGVIPAGHDLSNVAVPFVMNKTVGWTEIIGMQLLVKNINNNQQIASVFTDKIDRDNHIAYFNLTKYKNNFIQSQNYKFQLAYVGQIGGNKNGN